MLAKDDGTILTMQPDLEQEVLDFYKNLMGTANNTLNRIDVQVMRSGKQVSMEKRLMLVNKVTVQEVEDALKGIGDTKSPGIDGYGAYFFKACWGIIKYDVLAAIYEFFDEGMMYRNFNRTTVTLIPKHNGASGVKDIHNHIMLAYELVNGYNRKHGTPRCMMQLDLQKAYDMVDWRALEDIMLEIGLPNIFVDSIMLTVKTVSYEFNINGNMTASMQACRGIRQGDPISPLLFVIMMEYLNRLLLKMQLHPDFTHHPKCKKMALTHLTFANDVLMFCRGNRNSVEKMIGVINKFSNDTGLIINPSKCKVFFGSIDQDTKNHIRNITGFGMGEFPVKYLDVPLTSKKLTINHYMPLIEKIVSRINHWTSRLLSYAGRIQLVKSVIVATTQYWMACFPIPKCVLKKIESICRSFVWYGTGDIKTKSPVAWKTVSKPINRGGLDVVNLADWNEVCMMKCLWNLCCKADNLWVQWVHIYFIKDNDPLLVVTKPHWSWLIRNILESRNTANLFRAEWEKLVHERRFLMKQVYMLISDKTDAVPWSCLIQRNRARPRAVMHLWLMCHCRLPTKARLSSFGFIQETRCNLCGNSDETQDHLFFNCEFSIQVWAQVYEWLHITHIPVSWDDEIRWLIQSTNRKGWKAMLLKLAYTETLYGIWAYRNEVIFNQNVHRKTVDTIKDNIVYRGWYTNKLKKHIATILM
ncbi:uncharacterized protein LOC131627957 [Vicia villosa]|uniref:uncharacterized protein LOC131627957 n=1 Tax=Vicia villosa TaxID=3911 RepID=UPI00273B7A0F|nr:uncharacterized protein LOC131627957 [Vicia villosa]